METFEGFEVMEHAVFIYNNSSDWSDVREYLHSSRMLGNAPDEYVTNVSSTVSELFETKGCFKKFL